MKPQTHAEALILSVITLLETKNIPNKVKVYQEFKNNYPTSSIEELEGILTGIKSLASVEVPLSKGKIA